MFKRGLSLSALYDCACLSWPRERCVTHTAFTRCVSVYTHPDLQYGGSNTLPGGGGSGGEEVDFIND